MQCCSPIFSQCRVIGGRSTTKRPPLSSILDDKIDMYAGGGGAVDNDSFYSSSASAGPLTMERNDFGSASVGVLAMERNEYGSRLGSGSTAKDFPLFPSSSLRSDIFGNTGTDNERVNSTFASPAPVRPPLRSMMDGFGMDRGSSDRLNEFTPGNRGGAGAGAGAGPGAVTPGTAQRGGRVDALRSPVLTLGPYTPSMDRLVSRPSCRVVCRVLIVIMEVCPTP